MKKVTIISSLMALLLVSPLYAANPSFDCTKTDHDIEQLICKDGELTALDKQLAEAYRTAYQNFPADERDTLKAMQRGWVKGRNDCWKAEDPRGCVQFKYRSRITELQIQRGALVVPEPVQYQCDGGEYDSLTAVFYQETVIPAVVLTRGDDQVIAFSTPSGSGAKYKGRNVSSGCTTGKLLGVGKESRLNVGLDNDNSRLVVIGIAREWSGAGHLLRCTMRFLPSERGSVRLGQPPMHRFHDRIATAPACLGV